MKENVKKYLLPIVLILISIGLGIMVFWYLPHREDVKNCKIRCRYIVSKEFWEYPVRSWGQTSIAFPTQDQCIDYCLTVK